MNLPTSHKKQDPPHHHRPRPLRSNGDNFLSYGNSHFASGCISDSLADTIQNRNPNLMTSDTRGNPLE
ncbi:hypothetical protein BOC52_33355 [Burkholderia pseudomallei]|nr:hypothetical protein BOC39_33220 [Burkholderia pseudomallei]ARK99885.1 hypothetical protein BOC43_31190 [Burkholderia pseudomallei]ARL62005.1 hypothetical protein BOC52_33355 [Burkholderia pseudomallei]ARL68915.1 hypothetical protein BOC53_30440 [Burkholderia pseudomallei]